MSNTLGNNLPKTLPSSTLTNANKGIELKIVALKGEKDLCRKLREIGISEHMSIIKISGGTTLFCIIAGTRMALNHTLADCVVVDKSS